MISKRHIVCVLSAFFAVLSFSCKETGLQNKTAEETVVTLNFSAISVECSKDSDCEDQKICENNKCESCFQPPNISSFSAKSDEDICADHDRWWKIDSKDDLEKFKRHPDRCEGMKCTVYVDSLASGDDGKTFLNIQDAVDASKAGDIICVKPGVYYERYSLKDDYWGLYIGHGGTKDKPLMIVALGNSDDSAETSEAILDGAFGSKSPLNGRNLQPIDVGIFIGGNTDNDSANYFKNQPKYLEIYGLNIQNFKGTGLYFRTSCTRLGFNYIHDNAHASPAPNPAALYSLVYEYTYADGTVKEVYDASLEASFGKLKSAKIKLNADGSDVVHSFYGSLLKDGFDNDGDGLIDEADEKGEKGNIGRDGMFESANSIGNMFVGNHIYNNGYIVKASCADASERYCPMKYDHCQDALIDNASPNLYSCDELKNRDDLKNVLKENVDYVCVGAKAYIYFANPGTKEAVLGTKRTGDNWNFCYYKGGQAPSNTYKSIYWKAIESALAFWSGSGHGIYSYGAAQWFHNNIIHDNAGDGLSLRDKTGKAEISGNSLYSNKTKGIYFVGNGKAAEITDWRKNSLGVWESFIYKTYEGETKIEDNSIYNNGICAVPYLPSGVFIGPMQNGVEPAALAMSKNDIHDNIMVELFLQSNNAMPEFDSFSENILKGDLAIGPWGGGKWINDFINEYKDSYGNSFTSQSKADWRLQNPLFCPSGFPVYKD